MRDRLWQVRARASMILFIIFLAGLSAGIFFRHHRPARQRPYLMVAVLDVGAGDCTLIRTPNGHVVLIDTGPAAAEPLVADALRQQRVTRLDLLVVESAASGSVGGLAALINSGIIVKHAWLCRGVATSAALLVPLKAVHAACDIPGAGMTASEDGATLTAVWPTADDPPAISADLACRLNYGATSFLFAAPLDARTSRELVADAGEQLDSDVLLVPDGGGDGGTTPELLRRATPSIAVISCSAQPGALTIRRLNSAGADIYRTDTDGAVNIFTNGITSPFVKDPTTAH